MRLQEIENDLIRLSDEMLSENKRHKDTVRNIEECSFELEREKGMILKGIDSNKTKIAETILNVYGLEKEFDKSCTERAIKGIASNDGKIQEEYYGVKDYESFTHQTEDHRYGFGPRHGSIVFSIGLKKRPHVFTDEELECCLYYLNLLLCKESRKAIIGNE